MSNIKETAKKISENCVGIPGAEVEILGFKFVCAPLAFADMKKNHKRLVEFSKSGKKAGEPDLEFMGEFIFSSLKRNYPDLTQDLLDLMVDSANFQEIFIKVGEANSEGTDEGEG